MTPPPDRRRRRSAAPGDEQLFAAAHRPLLATATAQLSWLLERGYPTPSALALVGNRHGLRTRQRQALARAACSDRHAAAVRSRRLAPEALASHPLSVDGYNVLTTLEVALDGGLLIRARDGCLRDLAGVHGTWRRTASTQLALTAVGTRLATLGAAPVTWYLESSVSNSGRLRALLEALATTHAWPWHVHLVPDADPVLRTTPTPIATADREILRDCGPWFDLTTDVLSHAPLPPDTRPWILDLSSGEP